MDFNNLAVKLKERELEVRTQAEFEYDLSLKTSIEATLASAIENVSSLNEAREIFAKLPELFRLMFIRGASFGLLKAYANAVCINDDTDEKEDKKDDSQR